MDLAGPQTLAPVRVVGALALAILAPVLPEVPREAGVAVLTGLVLHRVRPIRAHLADIREGVMVLLLVEVVGVVLLGRPTHRDLLAWTKDSLTPSVIVADQASPLPISGIRRLTTSLFLPFLMLPLWKLGKLTWLRKWLSPLLKGTQP